MIRHSTEYDENPTLNTRPDPLMTSDGNDRQWSPSNNDLNNRARMSNNNN
jgi:hypothetical protein